MVRHSALLLNCASRLARALVAALLLAALIAPAVHGEEINPAKPPKVDPNKPPVVPAAEKPKGPEHSVTLMEERGVTDLFNKAAKARARAEKEPEAWPECVKCYADILKKYPNTVYLDKWEGPDKDHPLSAYKNGLYKSTRERVAAELASLPPAALTVYRVVNDPPARALFVEGQDQFDERKMEQVARDYFQTTWSSEALAWLAEFSFERGAWRDSAERSREAAKSPGKTATPMSLLARLALAQIHMADKTGAAGTLAKIEEALKDAAKGALRIGNAEGADALAKLKARVDALPAANATAQNTDASADWPTYFGDATHTITAQPRPGKGLRKWSVRIDDLLYGKNAVSADADKIINDDGTATPDISINQQLTVKDGFFYLNDGQVYAAYPAGNPIPGGLAAGGNAKFQLPPEGVKNPPKKKAAVNNRQDPFVVPVGIAQHPYFATLAGDRAYGVLGTEAFAQTVYAQRIRIMRGGGNDDEKPPGPSNYLVCFGRANGGRETSIVWSLKPADAAFLSQSKEDREWLKGAYFTSSPTYESGVLYTMALVIPGNADGGVQPVDAWAAAFDAGNGRLLWRTQICTATPMRFGGVVQPDRGLPVAVANRTVYVVTNLGAVAALDAGGGTVKWIRIYERTKAAVDQFAGMGEIAVNQNFWTPNPPMVYKNRLIVTPQDSNFLYCYDVETGARVWEKKCIGETDSMNVTPAGNTGVPVQTAQSDYKHVLGISQGALVLTSRNNVLFVNALNGKSLSEEMPVEGSIRGRGALTGNMAWISTDRDLLRIDMSNAGGKWKFAEPVAYKWADPKTEAGSVYSAGGVLYTVSHTHVNAYIVWEELEARLQTRLKEKPDDVAARVELADIYENIERFDQSLAELEKARQSADKLDNAAKKSEALAEIDGRKFETLMALGAKTRAAQKTDEAAGYLKQAYETALATGVDVMPVLALKAQAELYEGANNFTAAAQAYQRMIAKHGNVVLQDGPQSSKMARLYAQMRQSELKAKDPACMAAVDAEAKTALADAGNDPAKLERVAAQYPNSDHAGTALLLLARFDLEKSPDRARLNAMRCMSRQRGGPAAGTAQALAILAAACERLNLLASAHDALTALAANDDYKDAKISLQGIDAKADAAEVSARDWAAKRLADEPLYKRAPSQAVFSMGQGKLSDSPAWKKANGENMIPLIPDGIPPVEMRRAVFYLENQNEISAISGRDGVELWKPRPGAPANAHGRAFWWERLLIVCGERSIVAYDSAENGKIAWTTELKIDGAANAGYWAQISGDRLIVAHSGNALQGFDAASGGSLWRSQIAGSQMSFPPALGDGFLVVASANSNKLTAYGTETGGALWEVAVSELKAAPIVSAGRVFAAQRTSKLGVFDGKSGKPVCTIDMEAPATNLRAAGGLVIASLDNRELVAYRADPQNPGKAWQALLPAGSSVNDFYIDGDDLLVSCKLSSTKYDLAAYSIKTQGKLKWRQEVAADAAMRMVQNQRLNSANGVQMVNGQQMQVFGNGRIIIRNNQVINLDNDDGSANFVNTPDGSGGWVRESVARESLVLMQSNWDVSGTSSKVVTLIDRATGKSVWDTSLKYDLAADGSIANARVQLFDGGLVLVEGSGRTAYVSLNGADTEDAVKDLAAQAAKNPADTDARLKLATALYDKGEHEKAFASLVELLNDAKLDDAAFAAVYAQFAALRKTFAVQHHTALAFQRVDKAPSLNGGTAGWEAIPEKTFDSWLDVYLASEDANSRIAAKRALWRGPDDAKASFKGAYDETNLYIQVAVKDDLHSNAQAEGSRIDFGDALTLAFDIDLSGSVHGYRGETFELALGLAKTGKAAGWRRHEHGKYTRGPSPLESPFSVTRKEADKITLYQLALPLEYLGLKPEAGKKFGFTFAAQDQDAGNAVEKSICPSPGLIGMREPRCFSHGVLEAKK